MAEKKKAGRPPGRKITLALEKAAVATETIHEMTNVVEQMSENQRLIFESLMNGDDELTVALKSKNTNWFTGIAKVVYTAEGKPMNTREITLENMHDLADDSYQRLLRLCKTRVSQFTMSDYNATLIPIKEYLKKFTPMALGTIVGIARDGLKEENRLKAARDILDRAGEKAAEPEKDIVVPVQVNIVLTNTDGSQVQYDRGSK